MRSRSSLRSIAALIAWLVSRIGFLLSRVRAAAIISSRVWLMELSVRSPIASIG